MKTVSLSNVDQDRLTEPELNDSEIDRFLTDNWKEISRSAACTAASRVLDSNPCLKSREDYILYINQALLTTAAGLILSFPVGCLLLIRLNVCISCIQVGIMN